MCAEGWLGAAGDRTIDGRNAPRGDRDVCVSAPSVPPVCVAHHKSGVSRTVRRAAHRHPQAMKRTIIGVAVAALAAAAFATTSAQSAAACTDGVTKIGGVQARTFCGPATATVKIGSKTVSYRGGSCSNSSFGWSINIGTVVLGNAKKKPEYFGVTANAKAGSQPKSTVAVVHSNKTYAVIGTVALKAGLKSGTFSGKVFGSPTKLTGSFHC